MAKEKKEKKKEGGGIGELLAYAGNRKFLTYLGMGLSTVSQLLSFGPYVCIWFVARDLIAAAPNWSEATDIAVYGWWAVGFALASIVVYFAGLMCTHLAAFRCASNIRKATSEHLLKLPLGYFDTHATGELRRIVDGCAASTETLLAHMLPDISGAAAMVAGLLVLLFAFDWRLGAACLISVVISFGAMATMMSGKGGEFMKAYMGALVRMNKTGTEYVRGIPVVKVFQQTVHSFKAFHDAIVDYARMAQDYAGTFCRAPQVANLTALNGLVAFFLPVALLLAPGESDFARFVANFAFYSIFSAVVPTAMTKLMFVGEASQMSADSLDRIRSVMEIEPLAVSTAPKHPSGNSVRFDDVSFTYEGAEVPAVDHVSFDVPAGTTLALVGPSGGGKSTCASLIPRFWDATSGRVLVGGVDVRDINPHELMDHVAFVFQTNKLFHQTLADNVRAARPDATDAEVREALAAAQCDDIVAKLPQGIDTMLGAGGAYLSGGEVQRVALARAILKDAPIVVLDEATAFADPENEALIQRAFSRLAEGRTVIMIAHRLSTVVGADKVVVLDQGRVAESGVHKALLAKGGLYARMWADYEQAASWKISAAVADAAAVAAAKGGEA
ncbi:ABC transporter ATP-binding protein [Ellagibacter isourolithinifaciens]|uniref:ABC transporter ATP-binding protein n=1 Tax=Ellagibacter isourolithinifaciens TaxID=2137581 RepID=UPI0014780CD7|nr:ABC transporter ATP-binding protein [Ellagibacter isourolithinifaciens]